jgi:signal transduction histidine kinase
VGASERRGLLAAVGRLADSIAHEINKPLESVTNLLYLIRGSHTVTEVREYIDVAERELRRVALITNQTLHFHRQSTKPSEAFCYDLTGNSLAMFQGRLLNNHVSVEKKKRAEHPVDCLASEIRQVLNNLIGNAIDSIHLGERLLLRSREGTDFQTGGRGLVITVADTGAGMNAETKSKLFQAFYTTKGIGGSGLGPWISKDIVDRHRGKAEVPIPRYRRKGGYGIHPFSAIES